MVDIGAYERQAYTLTMSAVGQGSVDRQPAWPTYSYLDQAVLTAVAASGWTFAGWSGAADGMTNPITLTITGNMVTGNMVTGNMVTGNMVVTATFDIAPGRLAGWR